MAVKNLQDLFLETLKDLYYVEKTLVKKLPGMAKKASSPDLKEAIETHLRETEVHVERLDQIFEALGKKPMAKKCDALEGLLKEADETIGEISDAETRDAAIISSAQAVEHYEIARYGTLACWASEMEGDDLSELLEETLEEEKSTDEKLTSLAEGAINQRAAA